MAADTAVHQYQNILLAGRGPLNPGQLKVHPDGFVWRKMGGGKVVEVSRPDIASLVWLRVPRGYQLAVKLKAGSKVKFGGFREQDVAPLSQFFSSSLGFPAKQKELAISGRNWGDADIDGNMLAFAVGGRQAFEISLADVAATETSGKSDVLLKFHVDDTTGAAEKDSLLEMAFHVPPGNTTFVGTEEKPSAQVFQEQVLARADVGPMEMESVIEFEGVHVLTPRGRFRVQLFLSHVSLKGLAVDFKIQFKSIARIFVLPKANQPHTLLVITLDTPIRKGQTMYPHIVMQFPNEETYEGFLLMSEDLLESKYKDRLTPSYKGLISEVFAQVLRGLSGAKVTRPGTFRSNTDGFAIRTSLKTEEGYLYPLEKSCFFLPKPPTLILHDEVEYVEFERHGAGTSSLSSSYFDLVIRLKSDMEHQFRNIPRNEYHLLFTYFSEKQIKILNLGDADPAAGAGATAAAVAGLGDDDDVDPHLNKIRSGAPGVGAAVDEESDEEDEDFRADKDDGGSPTESSEGDEEGGGGGDSDASKDGSDDDEDEDDEERAGKESRPKPPKPSGVKRKEKEGGKGEEDGGKKQRKKKKKDPDAPKRALSGFMYFSQSQREQVKKENPGIAFGEIGKMIGEKWKKMSAEERAPFEKQAEADKARYADQMKTYKSAPPASAANGSPN